MVDAVVLAGGKEKLGHNRSKAALEFNGKRCIDYVVEALDGANVGKFLIVGDKYTLGKEIKGYKVVQERKGFFQNAVAGYDHFELDIGDEGYLFYIHSDIPLITSTAIDGFLGKSEMIQDDADLVLGLVDIEQINRFFPGYKNYYPYTRFKDFGFRMANCALIRPGRILDSKFERKYHIFENAYHARRFDQIESMIKFIWNGGPIFLYDLISQSLGEKDFYKGVLKREFYSGVSVKEFEGLLSKKSGLNFRLIKTYNPELAVDIDTLKDKEYVENHTIFGR